MIRTARDQDILETFCFKVRLMSLEQLARVWWTDSPSPVRSAKKRLRALASAGLLGEAEVLASRMLPLNQPVFSWEPGSDGPDAEVVSHVLRSRWHSLPIEPAVVYFPTSRTLSQLGGEGRGKLVPPGQETHDLHVAELYLRLLNRNPELARRWAGEESYRGERRGEKRPDAMLLDEHGDPDFVIEFAGSYDAEHVSSFHEDCLHRQLPYGLW